MLFSASTLFLKYRLLLVVFSLLDVTNLLVTLDRFHEDESPILIVILVLKAYFDNFRLLIDLVTDFEVSLALVQSSLPHNTLSQISNKPRINGILVLFILEYRIPNLSVAIDPFSFALDSDLAFNALSLNLNDASSILEMPWR